ncbi:hypothetical protein EJ02DRAFT_435475 [Clathrospora elynae]|uniref:Uncharacterized protein n=1 Tax=Clathrospora elynae TaxID=706981 RepID=A0A6A5SLT1_9PLEO|nr:hypothetical protein EJ02DRAFT_435475 [Clathrospora elynae]
MLVYRVEGIAKLVPQPHSEYGELTEDVYMAKPTPTEDDIEMEVSELLANTGPVPLPYILEQLYPFGFGHETAIAEVVQRITSWTMNGENFGLANESWPSSAQVARFFYTAYGTTPTELVDWFEPLLLRADDLTIPLHEVAYRDHDDGLWYARFVNEYDEYISDDEENLHRRGEARVVYMFENAHENMSALLDDAGVWDNDQKRYVKKA